MLRLVEQPKHFQFSYDLDQPLKAKIETIVRRVYGGAGVAYSGAGGQGAGPAWRSWLRRPAGVHGQDPVLPWSDDPAKLGRPEASSAQPCPR